MLRKCTDEEISNKECEKVIDPFYDNYDNYLEEYVVPEIISFYIASSFYRNAMWEATFKQHFNSAFDTFNLICKNYKKMKDEVIKLLRLKYSLEIINEDPLDFKMDLCQVFRHKISRFSELSYLNLFQFLHQNRDPAIYLR